jgi:ribokinase
MGGVFVVGSANLDYVLAVERRPGPGETVAGATLSTHGGGKGANQAVAAARLGAPVRMLGMVGNDAAGSSLLESLARAGVETSLIATTDKAATGAAFITLTPDGENSIVVASGANHQVTDGQVEQAADAIRAADALLLQLELPMEAVARAAALAADAPTTVVLNLAPPAELPRGLLEQVDVLVTNEHEAAALLDRAPPDSPQAATAAARALLERGPRAAVVTLGGAGAVLATGDTDHAVPAVKVDVVDTTGAGDAFVGALGARLVAGDSLEVAVAYAVTVGAAAVRRQGAQGSFPTPDEVEALARRG